VQKKTNQPFSKRRDSYKSLSTSHLIVNQLIQVLMKKINFSCVLIFVFTVSFAQKQELKLPLTIHNELSNHPNGFDAFEHAQELSDTSRIAKGCNNLTNLRLGSVSIYLEGIFTGWDKSFRNSFHYVLGTDKDGKEQLIIDRNNNSDFSDDSVVIPDTMDGKPQVTKDKLRKVSVEYDWVEKGKKVKQFVNVRILYNPKAKLYLYSFTQYATAILNGKQLEILPSNDISYSNFEIFNNSISTSESITSNKYLKDNDKIYRVKDLDINENVLILEKENRPFSKIESPQIGFRAPVFSGIDLITKKTVSLENYIGKYVYLDLWATWCSPCLEELPQIKELYDRTDHSKIEFIGIVAKDKPEKINKIINTVGINWKLVEENSGNSIFQKYRMRRLPTTLLIDPNGIVIKSNLRAEELKKFIENGFKDTTK